MKRKGVFVAISLVMAVAGAAVAHHAAQGIVDEEIYAMIDELVADTPHGDMTVTDLGNGMTEVVIFDISIKEVEELVAGGLLTYGYMLDGVVSAEITFGRSRDNEIIIIQQE